MGDSDKHIISGYSPSLHPVIGERDDEIKDIPEHLNLLPLYLMGLIKNVAFRGGTDVHPDERISAHMTLNSMAIFECLKFLHPHFFSVDSMAPNVGLPILESYVTDGKDVKDQIVGRNKILLPKMLNLSIERLSSVGIYLLDNGIDMYLWVGKASNLTLINSLFNCESLENANMETVKLVKFGNDIASRLDAIICVLREEISDVTPTTPKIHIIREGDDSAEIRFFWNLIEDTAQFNGGTYSYMDFMQFVRRGADDSIPQRGSLIHQGLSGVVATSQILPGRASTGENYHCPPTYEGKPPNMDTTRRYPLPPPPGSSLSTRQSLSVPIAPLPPYCSPQIHLPQSGITTVDRSGCVLQPPVSQYGQQMPPPPPKRCP